MCRDFESLAVIVGGCPPYTYEVSQRSDVLVQKYGHRDCGRDKLLSLRPYFMGVKIGPLQIKIGDYDRPIFTGSFFLILWE